MKRSAVLTSPVVDFPFEEPVRHFRFDDDGITDDIRCTRRPDCVRPEFARAERKATDA